MKNASTTRWNLWPWWQHLCLNIVILNTKCYSEASTSLYSSARTVPSGFPLIEWDDSIVALRRLLKTHMDCLLRLAPCRWLCIYRQPIGLFHTTLFFRMPAPRSCCSVPCYRRAQDICITTAQRVFSNRQEKCLILMRKGDNFIIPLP